MKNIIKIKRRSWHHERKGVCRITFCSEMFRSGVGGGTSCRVGPPGVQRAWNRSPTAWPSPSQNPNAALKRGSGPKEWMAPERGRKDSRETGRAPWSWLLLQMEASEQGDLTSPSLSKQDLPWSITATSGGFPGDTRFIRERSPRAGLLETDHETLGPWAGISLAWSAKGSWAVFSFLQNLGPAHARSDLRLILRHFFWIDSRGCSILSDTLKGTATATATTKNAICKLVKRKKKKPSWKAKAQTQHLMSNSAGTEPVRQEIRDILR